MVMKKLIFFTVVTYLSISAASFQTYAQTDNPESFSFVFMNDIHLIPGRGLAGFEKAIECINKLNPDLVISCGDLVWDVNDQTFGGADSLFNLYIHTVKKIKAPIFNGIGNHDVFGLYLKNDISSSHPMYEKKMFEFKIGKLYQTFIHKGWKFFILDDIDVKPGKIVGGIDSTQLAWISKELTLTDKKTPIIIALHIPLITALIQFEQGGNTPIPEGSAVFNSRELLDLFKGYNLKLVLQGHMHTYEDIYLYGIRFLTGGTVSGWKWNGPSRGTQPGFLQITTKNSEFIYHYIDYGWKLESK